MKNLLFTFLILISSQCYSQSIHAVTEFGRKVILNNDGTWEYVITPTDSAKNLIEYNIPESSHKKLKLKGNKVTIQYNSALWKDQPSDDPTKITLVHKDGDVYAMIIYERVKMDIEALKDLAINNAMEVSPNAKITYADERLVNGLKLTCMKIEGTIQSINFIYYGYYYTGAAGTLQLLTYTYQNLFSEYESVMSDFLNGVIINK